MNLNDINFANIKPKTKWLGALVIYCLVIANILWSLGSDSPTFTISTLDNGKLDFTLANTYRFLVTLLNYVAIIYMVLSAFNSSTKATTFWVCLAAITLVLTAYTQFGLCVLGYIVYPYAKQWMSAKFVQAVKSATAADSGTMPPNA